MQFDHLKRREFFALLGGAAAAWPLAARAQQGERVRRIGMLIHYSQTDRAFLDTVRRLGWTEGRNVRIEYRWSAGDIGREKVFAAELVRAAPDAIVVSGWTGLAELKRLTSVIPIVFAQVSDPVGSGLVASLARPGGNLTGMLLYEMGITGKWAAMLKEIAPRLERVALLANPK